MLILLAIVLAIFVLPEPWGLVANEAMNQRCAIIATDAVGAAAGGLVRHERNGLIVKGRYGKASWADEEAGLLREDYEPMYTPDPEVVQGIVEAVSRLVEDRKLRVQLGRAARADVETKYTPEQWNLGLKAAFDRAQGSDVGEPEEGIRETSEEEAFVR